MGLPIFGALLWVNWTWPIYFGAPAGPWCTPSDPNYGQHNMENAFDRFGLHCNLQYLCPHLKLHLDAIYAGIYVTFSYPVPMRNINLRKSTSAVEIGCEA